MARAKTFLLAGGTAFAAFAVGYVMQYGLPGLGGGAPQLQVQAITDTAAPLPRTASLAATPPAATPPAATPAQPETATETAAAPEPKAPGPTKTTDSAPDCTVTARTEETAGALVALAVSAPCNPAELMTVHHNGMMFTATTDASGALALDVPALSDPAVFILSFASGAGAVTQTRVSSLDFYDRVALQWQGVAGLELHAREMGADYFAEGHIWRGAPGSVATAARGEGGFLVRLGDPETPEARLAEVYSFPAGTAQIHGDVALSVEAEITAANCGSEIDAQVHEKRAGGGLRVQDLLLAMPGCEAIGDFVVLDDLLRDIEVASR